MKGWIGSETERRRHGKTNRRWDGWTEGRRNKKMDERMEEREGSR